MPANAMRYALMRTRDVPLHNRAAGTGGAMNWLAPSTDPKCEEMSRNP